jgi:hypothetical protein
MPCAPFTHASESSHRPTGRNSRPIQRDFEQSARTAARDRRRARGQLGVVGNRSEDGPDLMAHLKGLGEFVRRDPKFRPLVVCDDEVKPVAERAGFEAIPWSEFLLRGPPRSASVDNPPG